MWPQQTWGQSCLEVNDLWFKFLEKRSLYPHTLMYFCGTWTQWFLGRVTHVTSTDMGHGVKGHLGVNDLWFKFLQKGSLYPHTLMYYNGSWTNITMIAKVCDREGRGDSWFENRLVFSFLFEKVLDDLKNVAAIGLKSQTNNYEPSYQTTRPARDELPETWF